MSVAVMESTICSAFFLRSRALRSEARMPVTMIAFLLLVASGGVVASGPVGEALAGWVLVDAVAVCCASAGSAALSASAKIEAPARNLAPIAVERSAEIRNSVMRGPSPDAMIQTA